jgi:site-specific DNA-methyltransferase (adenine-specific)
MAWAAGLSTRAAGQLVELALMLAKVLVGDCTEMLSLGALQKAGAEPPVHLTFLDPPFNQGKDYEYFDDRMSEEEYWQWMTVICRKVHDLTADGGSLYFMQREKNAEQVLQCLRVAGWMFQNLIVWMKSTSAVPGARRFGKQYQIIAFATRGERPTTFHRLRIDEPLPPGYKQPRRNGLYVTDCWDDIRELTSGYFAGDEALRDESGGRFHKQQAPLALLVRIVLSSSSAGDLVLDPFAGTGTTLVASEQLGRRSVGIEVDPTNAEMIERRVGEPRDADATEELRHYYRYTENLDSIWPSAAAPWRGQTAQMTLPE